MYKHKISGFLFKLFMWCEKTNVEIHCYAMFFNVKCKWDLKYNEYEKLSTFYVNSQKNKDLDTLIYQFGFINSIHIGQNSIQLMKHLKSRVLKHAMWSLMTGLKRVFSFWNRKISRFFFLYIAKIACSRMNQSLVDVISVYEINK